MDMASEVWLEFLCTVGSDLITELKVPGLLLSGVIAVFMFFKMVVDNWTEGTDVHEQVEGGLCSVCVDAFPSDNGQLISLRIASAE